MSRRLFALLRTLIVAPAFVSLWLYFFPRWFGGQHLFDGPRSIYWLVATVGAVIGVPSVLAFAWRGLGTPAPFDPPRRLVVTGPYRWVRNPMYVGLGIVMLGEVLVYPNLARVMFIEMAVALVLVSILVVFVEEPGLRKTFGSDYEEYCRNVGRWIPRLTPWYAPAHLD